MNPKLVPYESKACIISAISLFSGLLLDKEVSCVLKYKGLVKKIHKSMSQNSHNTKNFFTHKNAFITHLNFIINKTVVIVYKINLASLQGNAEIPSRY